MSTFNNIYPENRSLKIIHPLKPLHKNIRKIFYVCKESNLVPPTHTGRRGRRGVRGGSPIVDKITTINYSLFSKKTFLYFKGGGGGGQSCIL